MTQNRPTDFNQITEAKFQVIIYTLKAKFSDITAISRNYDSQQLTLNTRFPYEISNNLQCSAFTVCLKLSLDVDGLVIQDPATNTLICPSFVNANIKVQPFSVKINRNYNLILVQLKTRN